MACADETKARTNATAANLIIASSSYDSFAVSEACYPAEPLGL
jgi:hypothetical protein